MRDDRPTKFEGPRYLGDATIVVIPPEGPERDELVERMARAMADQLFIGTSQANACALAALAALIGEKG